MNSIQSMPHYDRPRERLKRLGADALRSDELLAVLLGSGSKRDPVLQLSKELISRFGSVHALSCATLEELQEIAGIGPAKALKIKAAFELSSRTNLTPQSPIPIKTPEAAFAVAKPFIKNEKRETFLTLLLDVKSRLIAVEVVSIGILTETLVHPREVFFPAITRKAHSLIIVHNHPSSDVTPSKADIAITKQLIDASHLMNIPLLDHLIVSQNNFYSFRENGFSFSASN